MKRLGIGSMRELDRVLTGRRPARVAADERRQIVLDELAAATRTGAKLPPPWNDPVERAELLASSASALRDLVADVETGDDPLARVFGGSAREKLDPR